MNTRDHIVAGLGFVKHQAQASMVSTVSLAKQADLRQKLAGVNTRDHIVAGLGFVKHQAQAAMVSTVSLAKQADLRQKLAGVNTRDHIVAGLGFVKHQAQAAMISTVSLAKQADLRQKLAGVNTRGLVAGIDLVKRQATAVVAKRDGGSVTAVALVVGGAVGAYFLWPSAPVLAPAAAMMKAPGAGGAFLISRAAFLANPQVYFQILRTAGAAAAAAAFV